MRTAARQSRGMEPFIPDFFESIIHFLCKVKVILLNGRLELLPQWEVQMLPQLQMLAELLDKNQLYVNPSEIEDADFAVSAEDKVLNRAFYGDSN